MWSALRWLMSLRGTVSVSAYSVGTGRADVHKDLKKFGSPDRPGDFLAGT